ncbi:linear amide C-N hydrolase [bacterium]|nr:linear amide C-N hydrolase [bacterium]MBU1995190.1 linear amide C-N hydrolase [bacterium]
MKILYIFIIFAYNIFACTVFDTKSPEGSVLVGRNFDWSGGGGKIVFIQATPKTHGMLLLTQENTDMPYEGMNDKGLFVAISAVAHTSTTTNILKPLRTSLEMIKLILQNASNVDEAVDVFHNYSIVFGEFLGYPLIHYKIMDKAGGSLIIEFVNDEMKIINDSTMCRVMTNHYLSHSIEEKVSQSSYQRFDTVKKSLKNTQNVDEVFSLLHKVSQEDFTVWSNVYDLTKHRVYIKYKNNEIVALNLKDELYANNKGFYYDLQNIHHNKTAVMTKEHLSFMLRPHFGFGSNQSSHYGGRILLNAGGNKKYGLEFSKFETNKEKFSTLGIVLEHSLSLGFGFDF